MLWIYLFIGTLYGVYFCKIEESKVKKYHTLLAWLLCFPYIIVLVIWFMCICLFEKLNEPA